MKRLIIILLTLSLSLGLAGCDRGGDAAAETVEDGLTIVASIFPPYDFARNLAGENAKIHMLIRPGAETHSYDPTPSDMLLIQQCDLFLCIGGASEAWVDRVLQSVGREDLPVVRLIDVVTPLEEEIVEGMQSDHDDDHDDDHGRAIFLDHEHEFDEHIWTSPKNAILMAEAISAALVGVDPANERAYGAKLDAYRGELEALDAAFARMIHESERGVVVFGDRFPFLYFADTYQLDYRAAFPGCGSESEPSVATILYLTDFIKAGEIPIVFTIEFSNRKIARAISEQTGAQILEMHSCHNVTKEEFDAGVSYLSLMGENFENLKIALN